MSSLNLIEDSNLSRLWAKAFIKVMDGSEVPMLVATLKDIQTEQPRQPPLEIEWIRDSLDSMLKKKLRLSVETVAGTIFPYGLWNPKKSRKRLFKRYLNIWPRVSKCSTNRNGVYFHRLISYRPCNSEDHPVNQLDHIIETFVEKGNHRRSALQAAIFDPALDHSHQRQRGFPCLQHVLFTPKGDDLIVTGLYAKQHIFERAYGNYLGLYQLGKFMAYEMGLQLATVHCIATVAAPGKVKKKDVSEFISKLKNAIPD